jgi:serine/threonine-protein kinase RsbW
MPAEWVIPSDPEAAQSLAEDLLARVRAAEYSPRTCFAIRLALEEALINAIKHGNQRDPDKQIRVTAAVGGDRVEVTVRDEGGGFDPADVPDPTSDENLEKPCGRGIMLMRAYMDEVHFSPCGNEVRMVKLKAQGTP